MDRELICLIICFLVGIFLFYLLRSNCGCNVVEGNDNANTNANANANANDNSNANGNDCKDIADNCGVLIKDAGCDNLKTVCCSTCNNIQEDLRGGCPPAIEQLNNGNTTNNNYKPTYGDFVGIPKCTAFHSVPLNEESPWGTNCKGQCPWDDPNKGWKTGGLMDRDRIGVIKGFAKADGTGYSRRYGRYTRSGWTDMTPKLDWLITQVSTAKEASNDLDTYPLAFVEVNCPCAATDQNEVGAPNECKYESDGYTPHTEISNDLGGTAACRSGIGGYANKFTDFNANYSGGNNQMRPGIFRGYIRRKDLKKPTDLEMNKDEMKLVSGMNPTTG